MTTKSLKKFTELFNRNEGIALTPIIVIMVLMSVMGGVFTSIMGGWKLSAPLTINSNKAYYLAETATMFALQDARKRFFSIDGTSTPSGKPLFPSATTGIRSAPYIVSSSGTETAEFWIERPYPSSNTAVDEYPTGTHRGNNDDDTTLADDDMVDDDIDDGDTLIYGNPTDVSNPLDGFSDVYTIIATGKVIRGGATVAKRQIKTKVTIIPSPDATVAPGVQTSGDIVGTGGSFGMTNDDATITTGFGVGTNNNTGPDPETGIVIRPAQPLDDNFVKAIAIDQGHYNAVDLTIGLANDNYPEPSAPSFYFDSPTDTMPNFTYVENDFTVGSNRRAFGVVWVKGNVVLDGTATMEAVIICEGNITFNGTSDIIGGIVHYGSVINGNGNPTAVTIENDFFRDMSRSMPIVVVKSSHEAVSAN